MCREDKIFVSILSIMVVAGIIISEILLYNFKNETPSKIGDSDIFTIIRSVEKICSYENTKIEILDGNISIESLPIKQYLMDSEYTDAIKIVPCIRVIYIGLIIFIVCLLIDDRMCRMAVLITACIFTFVWLFNPQIEEIYLKRNPKIIQSVEDKINKEYLAYKLVKDFFIDNSTGVLSIPNEILKGNCDTLIIQGETYNKQEVLGSFTIYKANSK